MKLFNTIAIIALTATQLFGCEKYRPHSEYWGGVEEMEPPQEEEPAAPCVPESNPDAVAYADLHDPLGNAGQFYIPEMELQPEVFWYMKYTDYAHKEIPNSDGDENSGLQNFLLMQSIAGLVNRACAQGRTQVGVWIEQGGTGYNMEKADFGHQISSSQSAVELATKTYGKIDGYDVTVRDLFEQPGERYCRGSCQPCIRRYNS